MMSDSSMPKEDFERLAALRRDHELIDLQILQEETRKKIGREQRLALEAELELYKKKDQMADEALKMALNERNLLLATQNRLAESNR